MQINVEIGTKEQKELIRQEIELVLAGFESENIEVVVPIDFDKHIQRKLGDNRFLSNRTTLNQLVMGKLIGDNHLVFNPIMFTEHFNGQIRAVYYLHEFHHIINKKRIINDAGNPRDKKLVEMVNSLFDEYSSNRFAFEQIQKLTNDNHAYFDFFKSISEGHLENFSNDEIYSDQFDYFIDEFRHRRISIMEFVGKIIPLIERYSIELISYFSIVDSLKIEVSPVGEAKMNLIKQFRIFFETGNYSFGDKLSTFSDYLETFGVSIENHESGMLYYKVFER